jgi:uncharacterized protein YaaW (UPF0174 family)
MQLRNFVNKEIRHNYGHTGANLFREWFEPDYGEIVRATAEKLKINVRDHHTLTEIEDRILAEVMDVAKAKLIKEYGQSAWDDIERDVAKDIDEIIAKGGLAPGVLEQLKKARGIGIIGMLMAGRLAGFALYMVINQAFFAIARFVGIRIGVAVAGPIIGGSIALLLGPAGWLIAGLILFFDLGNTNWEKTIPSVVMVIVLRRKLGLA